MTNLTTPPQAPDLQEWLGRYGGYDKIPWDQWDAAMNQWAEQRRKFYVLEREAMGQGGKP